MESHHQEEAVLEELAYLSSKVGTLERELPAHRRRAARAGVLSTAAFAAANVAAFGAARVLTQSAHASLLTWRVAMVAAVGVAALAALGAAFAMRKRVSALAGYVADASAQPAPHVSQRSQPTSR